MKPSGDVSTAHLLTCTRVTAGSAALPCRFVPAGAQRGAALLLCECRPTARCSRRARTGAFVARCRTKGKSPLPSARRSPARASARGAISAGTTRISKGDRSRRGPATAVTCRPRSAAAAFPVGCSGRSARRYARRPAIRSPAAPGRTSGGAGRSAAVRGRL